MAASQSLNGLIKQSLGAKESVTTGVPSLSDLKKEYFSSGSKVSTNDGIRAFLQAQTGLTTMQSLSDLWRQYFIGKGVVNRVSLTDMANDYFTNQTLP